MTMRAALTLMLLASACASSLPRPTEEHAAAAGVARAELERGRAKYVDRCSSCHALFQPQRFPASTWQEMVTEMAPRAKLDSRDQAAILHYLVAFARRD